MSYTVIDMQCIDNAIFSAEIREELLDRLLSVIKSIECYIKKTDELRIPVAEYKIVLQRIIEQFNTHDAVELITIIRAHAELYTSTNYSEKVKKSIETYYSEIYYLLSYAPAPVIETRI